jgi:hypothetical protein
MPDSKNLEQLVEQAVRSVLDEVMPALRDQLVQNVMQSLEPELASMAAAAVPPPPPPMDEETEKLNRALATIQAGASQVEILDAMIEGAAQFAARTALFVVRGTNGVGWRARGFNDDEAVRSSPLELSGGLAGKALQARAMVTGTGAEFMPDFDAKFGAAAEESLMLPLMVRDKAVALIYADGGTEGSEVDRPALQSLVRTTGLWLEVFATRKATGAHVAPPPPAAAAEAPQAMAAAAPAPSAPAPAPEPPAAPPEPEPTPAAVEAPEPAPAPAAMPDPIPAGEDGEVHKKARRFAKLLVDEIKLYNQGKVSEGRQHRDLYDRLKDDIEKSRASYEKRYGNTVAKDGDYFNQELIRILADNDAALLGNNFRR